MRTLIKLYLSFYLVSLIVFLLSCNGSSSNHIQTPPEKSNLPRIISIYRTDTCTVTTIPLETYITCVVASEVPGSFHDEALKAQAVAARTYAYAKIIASEKNGCPDAHPAAPVCDTTHCQVYDDSRNLKTRSGWNDISDAVKATDSQLLYYNNDLVMHALFHASSGGRTENSEDVFVSAVPYLKSVESPYESSYERNGHGVGMSQQGANGMAKAGYTYEEILSHYYTGAVVR